MAKYLQIIVIIISTLLFAVVPHLTATSLQQTYSQSVNFSTHDLSFELTETSSFTACISGSLNETVYLSLTCDCGFLNLSNWNLSFIPPFVQQEITVLGNKPGLAVLKVLNVTDEAYFDTTNAFVRVAIYRHKYLDYVADVVGWIYFVAWTINFAPQMWTNYRLKNVRGLSLDFLSLNILGFFSYSMFNCGLYFLKEVRREYFALHPYGVMPVQIQDIAFALLAFLCSSLCGLQAIIYDRGTQKVSKICLGLLFAAIATLLIALILSCVNVISWLTYLYYFSYIKIGVTTIKCVPQVFLNYRRKSTKGWNIVTVLLDVVGGALSLLQMLIIAYNYDDWSSLSGDPIKLLLSVVSIFFDCIFIIQHYLLYGDDSQFDYSALTNAPEAAIN